MSKNTSIKPPPSPWAIGLFLISATFTGTFAVLLWKALETF